MQTNGIAQDLPLLVADIIQLGKDKVALEEWYGHLPRLPDMSDSTWLPESIPLDMVECVLPFLDPATYARDLQWAGVLCRTESRQLSDMPLEQPLPIREFSKLLILGKRLVAWAETAYLGAELNFVDITSGENLLQHQRDLGNLDISGWELLYQPDVFVKLTNKALNIKFRCKQLDPIKECHIILGFKGGFGVFLQGNFDGTNKLTFATKQESGVEKYMQVYRGTLDLSRLDFIKKLVPGLGKLTPGMFQIFKEP